MTSRPQTKPRHPFPKSFSMKKLLPKDKDAQDYDKVGNLLYKWWRSYDDIIMLNNGDVISDSNTNGAGDIKEIRKNYPNVKYVFQKAGSSDQFTNFLDWIICKSSKTIRNKVVSAKTSEDAWKLVFKYCMNCEKWKCEFKEYECKNWQKKIDKLKNLRKKKQIKKKNSIKKKQKKKNKKSFLETYFPFLFKK